MSSVDTPEFETIIQSTNGWSFLNFREIWAYRDLLILFVWRDIATRYKQTILGPLWFIVQPLLTTLIFTIVFGRVAKIPTAGVPPTLFYLCALLPWTYFSQTFQTISTTLIANAGLFSKVYFPRFIVPLSAALSGLMSLGIQFATFLVIYLFYKLGDEKLTFSASLESLIVIPLLVIQLVALGIGVGLWLAALTAKYRDFTILSGLLIQLWMYVTPVIYPLSQIPQRWQLLVALNPVTMPVECFRYVLLGAGSPTVAMVAISIGVTAVVLVGGIFLFSRVEKNFVDVI